LIALADILVNVMALGPLHTENRLSPRVIPRRKARKQRK